MDEMDGFLATVDEFVDDEERIVTYKWLSQQLAVPVNKSREILQHYAKSHKKNGDNGIHIVYSIIGRNSTGMCVKVVRDIDLESAKAKLDDVISTSLYSVQKMKLPNSSMLYSADFDGDRKNLGENSKFGGISYDGAVKLTKEDIKNQKRAPRGVKEAALSIERQFAKPESEKSKASQQKVNFFGKTKVSPPKKAAETETVAQQKQSLPKSDPKKSGGPAPSKSQKKGVAAFLTKGKTDPFKMQNTVKKVKEEPQKPEDEAQSTEKADKKSLPSPEKETSLYNESHTAKHSSKKVSEKAQKKVKNEPKKASSSSKRSRLEEDDLKIDNFSDNDEDFTAKTDNKKSNIDSNKTAKSKTKDEPKKTEKPKKKAQKKSTELPAKKRRRIQELSSSSSEEESEQEEFQEEMDVIPPSPPPKPKDPEVEKSPDEGHHKTMKKVLKTKTFVDEEGCMVTEKSFEFVECDEAETVTNGNSNELKKKTTEPEPKKKKFPTTSTAAQPKKPTKQASIMGFFKKK